MERQKFYKGQNVKADDLNELQDYTDGSQGELITSLLGYGVVSGFDVSIISGFLVRVGSGLAFSVEGNRLYLESATQVNLSAYTPNADTTKVKIGIVVDYTKSDPAIDSMGDTVYTKWTPTVQIVTGATLETGVFEIAEVTLSPVGVDSINTTAVVFDNLPSVEAKLQEEIDATNKRTSALVTEGSTTTLTSQIIKLLASEQMNLQSPLINLITSSLQVNGTEFMEIGSNDNGTYIKFESGLMMCFSPSPTAMQTDQSDVTFKDWIFPATFISISITCVSGVDGVGSFTLKPIYTRYRSNYMSTILALRDSTNYWTSCRAVAIGFWK